MNRQQRRRAVKQGKTESWGDGQDYHLPRTVMCPTCGHLLNGVGHPGHRHPPREGDTAVCIRCFAMARIHADGTLTAMSDAEYAETAAANPRWATEATKVINACRKAHAAVGDRDPPDSRPEQVS
jgi:hypothetical protein